MPQDRRPLAGLDFLEENGLTPPVPQHRLATGRPDVRDPSNAFAEHRDEIPLAFDLCDDHGKRPQAPAAASTDLERRQPLRPDARRVQNRLSAIEQTRQAVRAATRIQPPPRV
jgi:hypothetical protein